MIAPNVMLGLVPGIHVFQGRAESKTWMAGTSPATTTKERFPNLPNVLEPNRGSRVDVQSISGATAVPLSDHG
jgi:hypothetical protein